MPNLSQLLTYLVLLASLMSATALQAEPTTPAPGRLVYRIDASPPEEVFSVGIGNSAPSEGTLSNYDILDHSLGLICWHGQRSPWISTTRAGREVSGFLANQIRRENPASGSIETWVYTVDTDDSYLDVESVMQQVIAAGQSSQYGYGPAHAQRLQQLLGSTSIRDRAEVLTLNIAPARIRHANRLTLTPTGQAQWGAPINNPNYRPFTPDGSSHLPTLAQTIPPNSRGFSTTAAVAPANATCFQTCDGASASERKKRSVNQAARTFDYCPTYSGHARALIGSED